MTWRRVWAAYCIAHTGKSLLWAASDLLTLYVLVNRYGVTPAVAGALFLAGLTASAVADLGVGAWLGRRPGDATRMAVAGLCIAGVTFPLTMLSAPLGPGAVLAATLLFRVAYAGCDVPHNALMGRLADDPARATSLSRGRTLGTGIASVAAAGSLGDSGIGIVPMLWGIGAGATVLGLAMVPLLVISPLAGAGGRSELTSYRLPWTFLFASVTGIVALGALGKAMLHLSGMPAPTKGMSMLMLLIAGRTASACLPLSISSARQGLTLLAAIYAVSAVAPLLFIGTDLRSAAPLLLGLVMGLSNLIGWALLALLAREARDYGLYTMTSKLALGAAGLTLAGGLGRSPVFTTTGFAFFAIAIASACTIAALLCLTCSRRYDLHAS
ncbi:hypothetical protein [Sphingomonas carotinifaciens]|uniref:Na+/melibiose symporter n=1 Tax=Sphingomonas carotinifaciens TaxID=1166323 RepID=A0A1G7S4R8_9SPHN|nr:hypothetical protein [Sphingomonas carotinifaciens]MBB4088191.1 MFS family permease [Sphingomonas carotinifaciens]MWC42194.1 hypothetical protein [Sphingomonas carotinifaciens]SDG17993.1 Na+/melibiose symporter [Sphingomonas carotinifaciens]